MARLATLAIAVLMLAIAPAASAMDRYAAPSSRGTGDCSTRANACDVATAINGAVNGDQVFVLGNLGPFSLGSSLLQNGNGSGATIHVHGINGRPQLNFTTGAITLDGGSSIDNVALASARNGTYFAIRGGASADRVIVKATGGYAACQMGDATLTNSICWSAVPLVSGATVLGVSSHAVLRNDTIYAAGTGSGPGISVEGLGDNGTPGIADLVNVIARGEKGGGPGVRTFSDGSEDATVNLSHSNTSTATTPGQPTHQHINTDATDQLPNPSRPLFVDALHGNFREARGAPTIDHGVNSPANKGRDVEGNPRLVHVHTDIGADEFLPNGFAGVAILTKKATVTNGHLTIRVRCPSNAAGPLTGGPGSCAGRLTLRTAKKVRVSAKKRRVLTLGSSPFAMGAGKVAFVEIALSSKGLDLLKKQKTLKARGVTVAHDQRAVPRTRQRQMKLSRSA